MAPSTSSRTSDDLANAIGADDLSYTYTRSSGPGGQNVNKVNTRVTLLFDLAGCATLTIAEKRRIRTKLSGRLSASGSLRVVSSRHRTQVANRRAAKSRLFELLAEAVYVPTQRIPTSITRGAKRRRLKDKRARSDKKRLRASRPAADD